MRQAFQEKACAATAQAFLFRLPEKPARQVRFRSARVVPAMVMAAAMSAAGGQVVEDLLLLG
jgi:hypothetical protein